MTAKSGSPDQEFVTPPQSPSHTSLAHKLSVPRDAVFQVLVELANDNRVFFDGTSWQSAYIVRLSECCRELSTIAHLVEKLVCTLQEHAPRFDFEECTPGNGLRSLVCIVDIVVLHLIRLLRQTKEQRQALLFRASFYCKELEAYGAILRFMTLALPEVVAHLPNLPNGCLFPPLNSDYRQFEEMLRSLEELDSTCFYGRPLGFQFAPSVGRVFHFIGVILASYSLTWEKGHGAVGSLLNTGHFYLAPEKRAQRIVQVTREADIAFCKAFWNLAELGNVCGEQEYSSMPRLFCPTMTFNELLDIPWVGPIGLASTIGGRVDIPEPSAHTGKRPVRIRILSYNPRQGMNAKLPWNSGASQPASPYLLFHCHGGGYVATTSKSHETYLRTWAKQLDCTILSVDYSLAPENPFPRPTEEVLFAYAWTINNAQQLGWTGEKMCMVGDSAGGNLLMSLNLRLLELNVARKPDGLVLIYTPFLFQYLPSPSRLLSFMDPLLHTGVVLRCAAAYTSGSQENRISDSPPTDNGDIHKKSLQEYVEEVQKEQQQQRQQLDVNSSETMASLLDLQSDTPSGKTESDEMSEKNDDDESLPSVEINRDPSRIWLASGMYDHDFVDFLRRHPLTSDSLQLVDNDTGWQKHPLCRTTDVGRLNDSNRTPGLAETAAKTAGQALDTLISWFDCPTGTIEDRSRLERPNELHRPPSRESSHSSSEFSRLRQTYAPKNPLISPMYADDRQLRALPPMWLLACHLDPLLDDTISFANRLRSIGGPIRSVDLLDSLPHGFLNFTLMSPECRNGAKLCLRRIRQALQMPDSQ